MSKKEKSMKTSIYLQSEATEKYIITSYTSSSKLCLSIGKFVLKILKTSFFFKKKSGNREKSINKVTIWFLYNFCIFKEVATFSAYIILQEHWPGFTKILVGRLQKKDVTFEVRYLEPSNLAILCLMWCTWKSHIIEAFEIFFRCVKLNMGRMMQFCTAHWDRVTGIK